MNILIVPIHIINYTCFHQKDKTMNKTDSYILSYTLMRATNSPIFVIVGVALGVCSVMIRDKKYQNINKR